MPRARTGTSSASKARLRPALSEEAREKQMISLAVDLVEQRLRDGTASSQETTHFLKLGSSKHRLEMERLEEENKLLRAKTQALEDQKESKEFHAEVLRALRNYNGQGDPDEY